LLVVACWLLARIDLYQQPATDNQQPPPAPCKIRRGARDSRG